MDNAVKADELMFVNCELDKSIKERNVEELLILPKVIVVNKFTEESAKEFAVSFSEAENTGQPVIPIYIDSYGGHVYSLLSMIDVIKQAKVPVATIAIGKAMSCGAFLLSQGADGYRFASKLSTIMIHDVASFAHGKVEEIKADAIESDRLNKLVYQLMDIGTGNQEGYFPGIVHEKSHADWYLTSEDALKHKLINHIRVPKFNIAVRANVGFG